MKDTTKQPLIFNLNNIDPEYQVIIAAIPTGNGKYVYWFNDEYNNETGTPENIDANYWNSLKEQVRKSFNWDIDKNEQVDKDLIAPF